MTGHSRTTFAVISDTHIACDPAHEVCGCRPFEDAICLVDAIRALPFRPDFVVHCGDVCGGATRGSVGSKSDYAAAFELFGRVGAPVFYVRGNHDAPDPLLERVASMGLTPLSGCNGSVCYEFPHPTGSGIVLDAVRAESDSGRVPENQLAALSLALLKSHGHVSVFVHFPPLSMGSAWADEMLCLENGRELHEVLTASRRTNISVFFGHIHRPLAVYVDGIVYQGAGPATFGFDLWPGQHPFGVEVGATRSFSLVTIEPGCLVARPVLYLRRVLQAPRCLTG